MLAIQAVDAEVRLAQVADHGLDAVASGPQRSTSASSLSRGPFANQHVDVAVALQQLLDEVPPDESGRAGDEVAMATFSATYGQGAYTPRPPPAALALAKRRCAAPGRPGKVGRPDAASSARPSPRADGRTRPGPRARSASIVSCGKAARPSAISSARSRCPPVLDDLGDQAHRERLGGLEDPAREDEVERAAQADDARQPLRAAVDERDAAAALGEAEREPSAAIAQVAPQRELEAAGQAPAPDRGDRRLGGVRRVKPSGPRAPRAVARACRAP